MLSLGLAGNRACQSVSNEPNDPSAGAHLPATASRASLRRRRSPPPCAGGTTVPKP